MNVIIFKIKHVWLMGIAHLCRIHIVLFIGPHWELIWQDPVNFQTLYRIWSHHVCSHGSDNPMFFSRAQESPSTSISDIILALQTILPGQCESCHFYAQEPSIAPHFTEKKKPKATEKPFYLKPTGSICMYSGFFPNWSGMLPLLCFGPSDWNNLYF